MEHIPRQAVSWAIKQTLRIEKEWKTSHGRVKLEIITAESPVCGILLCTPLNNIWVSGEISREKNILNCMKIKLQI